MAEEKSLACHADLDGRSQPSGALLQEEGRSHPRGDVPFVGTKGFRSQGREQQKGARQPSSTGAASHGKPHAHLFLFFLFLLGTPWYHQVIAVFQVAGRGLVCCKELLPSGLCTRAEGAPASPWDFRRLGIAG